MARDSGLRPSLLCAEKKQRNGRYRGFESTLLRQRVFSFRDSLPLWLKNAHLALCATSRHSAGSALGLSVSAPLSTHGLGERLGRGRRSGRLVARNESRAARRDERGQDEQAPNQIGSHSSLSAADRLVGACADRLAERNDLERHGSQSQ